MEIKNGLPTFLCCQTTKKFHFTKSFVECFINLFLVECFVDLSSHLQSLLVLFIPAVIRRNTRKGAGLSVHRYPDCAGQEQQVDGGEEEEV